jgi:hypothetical protein
VQKTGQSSDRKAYPPPDHPVGDINLQEKFQSLHHGRRLIVKQFTSASFLFLYCTINKNHSFFRKLLTNLNNRLMI